MYLQFIYDKQAHVFSKGLLNVVASPANKAFIADMGKQAIFTPGRLKSRYDSLRKNVPEMIEEDDRRHYESVIADNLLKDPEIYRGALQNSIKDKLNKPKIPGRGIPEAVLPKSVKSDSFEDIAVPKYASLGVSASALFCVGSLIQDPNIDKTAVWGTLIKGATTALSKAAPALKNVASKVTPALKNVASKTAPMMDKAKTFAQTSADKTKSFFSNMGSKVGSTTPGTSLVDTSKTVANTGEKLVKGAGETVSEGGSVVSGIGNKLKSFFGKGGGDGTKKALEKGAEETVKATKGGIGSFAKNTLTTHAVISGLGTLGDAEGRDSEGFGKTFAKKFLSPKNLVVSTVAGAASPVIQKGMLKAHGGLGSLATKAGLQKTGAVLSGSHKFFSGQMGGRIGGFAGKALSPYVPMGGASILAGQIGIKHGPWSIPGKLRDPDSKLYSSMKGKIWEPFKNEGVEQNKAIGGGFRS